MSASNNQLFSKSSASCDKETITNTTLMEIIDWVSKTDTFPSDLHHYALQSGNNLRHSTFQWHFELHLNTTIFFFQKEFRRFCMWGFYFYWEFKMFTSMFHVALATLFNWFLALGVCLSTMYAAAMPYSAPTCSLCKRAT